MRFSKKGDDFFRALGALQNREWFHAHKADYQSLWAEPMKALLEDLRARMAKHFPAAARGEVKHFRLYRDVRFSNDKSPFYTVVRGAFQLFPGGLGPLPGGACYAELGSGRFVVMGHYWLEGERLKRWRKALVSPSGLRFGEAHRAAMARGYTHEAHATLKGVPHGFDKTHPNAALLALKGYSAGVDQVPDRVMRGDGLAAWLEEKLTPLVPLVKWADAAARGKPLPKL